MFDSKYYYNQLMYYKNILDKIMKERDLLRSIQRRLEDLNLYLPDIKSRIERAKGNYLNGGFISNNETFDNGKLDECSTITDNTYSDIDSLIIQVGTKAFELDNTIIDYNKQYETANINYQNALTREQGD